MSAGYPAKGRLVHTELYQNPLKAEYVIPPRNEDELQSICNIWPGITNAEEFGGRLVSEIFGNGSKEASPMEPRPTSPASTPPKEASNHFPVDCASKKNTKYHFIPTQVMCNGMSSSYTDFLNGDSMLTRNDGGNLNKLPSTSLMTARNGPREEDINKFLSGLDVHSSTPIKTTFPSSAFASTSHLETMFKSDPLPSHIQYKNFTHYIKISRLPTSPEAGLEAKNTLRKLAEEYNLGIAKGILPDTMYLWHQNPNHLQRIHQLHTAQALFETRKQMFCNNGNDQSLSKIRESINNILERCHLRQVSYIDLEALLIAQCKLPMTWDIARCVEIPYIHLLTKKFFGICHVDVCASILGSLFPIRIRIQRLAEYIHKCLVSDSTEVEMSYKFLLGTFLNLISDQMLEYDQDVPAQPLQHLIACVPGIEVISTQKTTKFRKAPVRSQPLCNENLPKPKADAEINAAVKTVSDLLKDRPMGRMELKSLEKELSLKRNDRQWKLPEKYNSLDAFLRDTPKNFQVIGFEDEKVVALSHRAQTKRFINDIQRVIKKTGKKELRIDEIFSSFSQHLTANKQYHIRQYGVCCLEDMMLILPQHWGMQCNRFINECGQLCFNSGSIDDPLVIRSVIQTQDACQKRRTIIFKEQVKTLLANSQEDDCQFRMEFNKFIPAYHKKFEDQCTVQNYGCQKLMDLFEHIKDIATVDGTDPENAHIILTEEAIKSIILYRIKEIVKTKAMNPDDVRNIYLSKYKTDENHAKILDEVLKDQKCHTKSEIAFCMDGNYFSDLYSSKLATQVLTVFIECDVWYIMSDIQNVVPTVSPDIINLQIRRLCDRGIIEQKPSDNPLNVCYNLSERFTPMRNFVALLKEYHYDSGDFRTLARLKAQYTKLMGRDFCVAAQCTSPQLFLSWLTPYFTMRNDVLTSTSLLGVPSPDETDAQKGRGTPKGKYAGSRGSASITGAHSVTSNTSPIPPNSCKLSRPPSSWDRSSCLPKREMSPRPRSTRLAANFSPVCST